MLRMGPPCPPKPTHPPNHPTTQVFDMPHHLEVLTPPTCAVMLRMGPPWPALPITHTDSPPSHTPPHTPSPTCAVMLRMGSRRLSRMLSNAFMMGLSRSGTLLPRVLAMTCRQRQVTVQYTCANQKLSGCQGRTTAVCHMTMCQSKAQPRIHQGGIIASMRRQRSSQLEAAAAGSAAGCGGAGTCLQARRGHHAHSRAAAAAQQLLHKDLH